MLPQNLNLQKNQISSSHPQQEHLILFPKIMGNCLILHLQQKTVRVMKTDGKIIEYKSPIKVHQLLSEYSHHAVSDKLPVIKHLHPNTNMVRGHMYYLLPLPVAPPSPVAKKKKTVRFADDVVEKGGPKQAAGSVVRIKVVISKQELQAMLGKGGVAVEDMISHLQKESSIERSEGSMPSRALETIPEVI